MEALDSGNNAAAVKFLEETTQGLPTVEAKTHIAIAINVYYILRILKAQGYTYSLLEVIYKIQPDDNYPST
jgi:hypothetical protein